MLTISGMIPKFGQNPISYIELDELTDAYLTLDITICFKATAENGLILFKKGTVIRNQLFQSESQLFQSIFQTFFL